MPTEPCCSPVVWTFRWGRGLRVLGPSLSLDSLSFLCSSELLWNAHSFQEQSQGLLPCSAPREAANQAPSHLLSFWPHVWHSWLHRCPPSSWRMVGITIFCALESDDGRPLWQWRKHGFKLSEAMDSPDTVIPDQCSHYLLLITKALIIMAATPCFKWCLLCSTESLTQKRARGTTGSQYLSWGTRRVTFKLLKWSMGGFRGLNSA